MNGSYTLLGADTVDVLTRPCEFIGSSYRFWGVSKVDVIGLCGLIRLCALVGAVGIRGGGPMFTLYAMAVVEIDDMC